MLANRRQVHRRIVPGLNRLQARFSPTAIFDTTLPTVATLATTPDTTSAAVVTPGKLNLIPDLFFPCTRRLCLFVECSVGPSYCADYAQL